MSRKVEEMILAFCRKHPEVRSPPLRKLPWHGREQLATSSTQGVQDTVLEAELPGVAVNERAEAINSLLASLKLQVCARAVCTTRKQFQAHSRPARHVGHGAADPRQPRRPKQPHL